MFFIVDEVLMPYQPLICYIRPLGIWAFIVLVFISSYSIAYFTPPKDKIYQYTKIRLSEETKIFKKHYDLDSMDFSCAFEIQLSQIDHEKLKQYLRIFNSTSDGAVERLPKSWPVIKIKNLQRFQNEYNGVLIYCDLDPETKTAWLIIQTT
jgi:hypothetical protein